MNRSEFLRLAFAGSVAPGIAGAAKEGARRKLVLIAGPPSHPPLMHEFRAGTILLEERLRDVPGLVVDRHEQGWVKDEATFTDADAVVCFSDGNGRHPVLAAEGRLATMEGLAGLGVGFGCMHFAVEVPKDTAGPQFREWIGGCYEHEWSCNPIWEARFDEFPEHPITRGVKPFSIKDEWYFNMRFAEGFGAEGQREIDGVRFTPVLVATPTDETREGPYVYPKGPYPHIQEARGRREAVMWAVERPDGGRGFGFTGGHFHVNWQNDDFRKVILNALCWVAKVEVPASGIGSAPVGDEEINRNLDDKKPRKRRGRAKGGIQLFNGKDLSGWTPKIRYEKLGEDRRRTFRVADGVLQVNYEHYDEFNETFGHLFYKTPYSRYRLRVEYRFLGDQLKGGPGWAFRNSGLMLHGQDPETMKVDQDFPDSIEVQLLGGKGEGKRTTLNLCTPGTDVIMDGKPLRRHCINSTSKTYHGDQWVTAEVVVDGSKGFKHIVEGEVVLEYQNPHLDDGTVLEGGTISLQSESHPCEFRKVELFPLE